ncbi:MAG: glycosyltransferase [Flavobacteriales bacterium]|nr:glycosyltransferase [Flavobacteriales bacterium]
MNVFILHFTHPEGYPPALNAINYIADHTNKVTVLSVDTLPTKWNYNKNVDLILLEGNHNRFEYIKRSKFQKLKTYANYIIKIYKTLKKGDIDLVICYDDVPFFLYKIASSFISKKTKLWVHNHDVYPITAYKKYGINWFGATFIQKYFNTIDYFSLPALERKIMFPFSTYTGKFFFIPNYPSDRIIKAPNFDQLIIDNEFINIIYPGSPSFKNGFEELIDIFDKKVNGKTIRLTIVGDIPPRYESDLKKYAQLKGVESQLFFKDRIPYSQMTDYLKNFHIGWGLYKPVDLSVSTAGTSSNKIYEFLANGLPIIVYDNEHHKEHLQKCEAAFFSDLSKESILSIISIIDKNMIFYKKLARKEFEDNYQFEKNFKVAFNTVQEDISCKY